MGGRLDERTRDECHGRERTRDREHEPERRPRGARSMGAVIRHLQELDLEPAEDPHPCKGGIAGREPEQGPAAERRRAEEGGEQDAAQAQERLRRAAHRGVARHPAEQPAAQGGPRGGAQCVGGGHGVKRAKSREPSLR